MQILLPNILKYSAVLQKFSQSKNYDQTRQQANSTVDKVKTAQFHIFPKVHKPNAPGRPVVSSVKCDTSKISKFVDHYLQPHVKSLPLCIKDTSDFINRINETKETDEDTILVTSDVKSMYPNSPNHKGQKQ